MMETHWPAGRIQAPPSFSGPNWSQFPPLYTVHHTHRPHRISHFCLDTSGFPILSFLPLYTAPLPPSSPSKYVSVLPTIENLPLYYVLHGNSNRHSLSVLLRPKRTSLP